MNKNIIIGSIVVLAMVGIGWLVLRNDRTVDNPSVTNSPSATPTPTPRISATPRPVLSTVHLTSQGPVPMTRVIRVGDAVKFVNDGPAQFSLTSTCPNFDSGRVLAAGESYTLTFTTARTCTYSNRLGSSSQSGTIIVQ